MLEELASPDYLLAPFNGQDLALAHNVISRYRDLRIGLTDASLVVLAERHRTDVILTLDERHFRVLKTASGRPFRLFPADS